MLFFTFSYAYENDVRDIMGEWRVVGILVIRKVVVEEV